MAVQFDNIPSTSDFQSTAEPIIIQVSETATSAFFKYNFILEIKNEDGLSLAKLKLPFLKDVTNSLLWNRANAFDVSRVLDDYLGPMIYNSHATSGNILTLGRTGFSPTNLFGLSDEDNPTARFFTLELGFESATSATDEPTENLNEASTTLIAFRDEFENDGEAYARGSGTFQMDGDTKRFLSSAPDLGVRSGFGSAWGSVREHRIGTDQAYVLGFGVVSDRAFYLLVRGFEADGTTIGTAGVLIAGSGGDPSPDEDSERVQYVGVGPANLEEHAAADSNTDLTNLITDADLAYYEVYLSSTISVLQANQKSVVHRFTIDEGCSVYPRKQLLFLNRHGGWDCFNFDQKSEESLQSIERSSYNRPRGNWDDISDLVDWTYNGWERGVTTTTVKAEKQIRVSTDYIDEGYNAQLRDIATSRAVFLVDGTNLIPVVVTDSEYLFKTSANDKLISYSFTLRYSNRPRLK